MFWRSKNAGSLALRLSAWYAGSAFLLLLAGTGFLYWELLQSFNAEDDQYLTEKANTLRELVGQRDLHTLRWEAEGESTARPGVELLSRVFAPGGSVLVETPGMAEKLPAAVFPPCGRFEYRSSGERIFRVLSSCLPDFRIQVAVETTFERKLLAGYRQRLWTVLGIGLFFSAAMGYWLARRGIRPVKEIARAARRIGSSTLDERVETAALPSELTQLASTFNEMLDRLEEAFGRLSRFSSDIAHELRTPLNNVRGEIEVALSKVRSPEEYREALGSSLEECLRLSRIIDSLLFLARADQPQAQIHRETVDVGEELRRVRDFYEAAAGEAGISLELSAASGLSVPLDRTLFQRAVGNLIENSLVYTAAGGHILLEAGRDDGRLLVSVADDGCGIPADHLARVFDRFYRVDAARSKNSGGTGLGLAIIKSVAALHGGEVQIESTPGQGTRVTLSFPAA